MASVQINEQIEKNGSRDKTNKQAKRMKSTKKNNETEVEAEQNENGFSNDMKGCEITHVVVAFVCGTSREYGVEVHAQGITIKTTIFVSIV